MPSSSRIALSRCPNGYAGRFRPLIARSIRHPITVLDKPSMNFGDEHSAHCLRYGQALRGRRSGVPGWPSAPAPKRTGGVATGGARRSERLIGNCRARAPRPGNVSVAGGLPIGLPIGGYHHGTTEKAENRHRARRREVVAPGVRRDARW